MYIAVRSLVMSLFSLHLLKLDRNRVIEVFTVIKLTYIIMCRAFTHAAPCFFDGGASILVTAVVNPFRVDPYSSLNF